MSLSVSIVVGNPQPRSRTRTVAERVAELLVEPGSASTTVIELADHAETLIGPPGDDDVERLLAGVASSDLVVVASPTYKASYTGLLKTFLDRYESRGLAGVVALPVLTMGNAAHTLATTTTLLPLLVELGATVPACFTVPIGEFARLDDHLAQPVARAAENIARIARLAAACRPRL